MHADKKQEDLRNMTRKTSNYRERGRAVFLAAIMVLSVVAMTAAVGVPVAATHDPGDTDQEIALNEDPRVFVGQHVVFNLTGANASTDFRIVGDNEGEEGVFTTDSDGHSPVIDTSNFAADDYDVIHDTNDTVATSFRLRTQSLDASFDPGTIDEGENSTLVLETQRTSNFNVTITSPDETFEDSDLEAIFENATSAGDFSVQVSNLTGGLGTPAEIAATLENEDPGTHDFDVDVTDSTASDTASVDIESVSVPDAEADFVNDPYTGIVGDHVTMDLETTQVSTMNVTVDGPGYSAELELGNVSDEVEIEFNTFEAGQGTPSAAYSLDGATLDNATETEFGGDFRLDPEDYDLAVTIEGEEDESDFAGLSLLERSTDDATTHIAPKGTSLDTDDLSDWTAHDEVAINDELLVRVNVTGVFAYIDDNITVNGTSFGVELQNPDRYQTADEFDLTDPGVSLTRDEANGKLYIVIDMESSNQSFEDGQEWEATFAISDDNPYVDDGESASAAFTVVDRDVGLDVVESPYQMTPTNDSFATGTSTLAPGTEVNVRFRKGGADGFIRTVDTDVNADGIWNATEDFSDRSVGEEFEIRVRSGGTTYVDDAAANFSDVPERDTTKTVAKLQEENQELQAALDEANATIEEQTAQISELTERAEGAESEAEFLRERVSNLESALDNTEQELEDTRTSLNQEIDSLESEIQSLEQLNSQLTSDLNSAQNELDAIWGLLEQYGIERGDDPQAGLEELNEMLANASSGDSDSDSDSDAQPGFTPIVALIALLGGGALLARREFDR